MLLSVVMNSKSENRLRVFVVKVLFLKYLNIHTRIKSSTRTLFVVCSVLSLNKSKFWFRVFAFWFLSLRLPFPPVSPFAHSHPSKPSSPLSLSWKVEARPSLRGRVSCFLSSRVSVVVCCCWVLLSNLLFWTVFVRFRNLSCKFCLFYPEIENFRSKLCFWKKVEK